MELGKIETFIRAIKAAENTDEIFLLLAQQIERMGFDRFTYAVMWGENGKLNPISITSYPEDWVTHYNEKKYEPHDMVFRYAAQMVRPFMWKEISDNFRITKNQKIIFAEAESIALNSGASVPIHGPGRIKATLSVASRLKPEEMAKIFVEKQYELHLLSTFAHENILRCSFDKPNMNLVSLTPREIETLTWTAVGKSKWEISEILEISEDTVKKHLLNACNKLSVSNKTHAVSVSLINCLIAV